MYFICKQKWVPHLPYRWGNEYALYCVCAGCQNLAECVQTIVSQLGSLDFGDGS